MNTAITVTDEIVEAAARAMVTAWCYAHEGTPDWNMHWRTYQVQYRKQARLALEAALSGTPSAGEVVDEGAKLIAAWINYDWDGLPDNDISDRFRDWSSSGRMQGGKPALRKLAAKILALTHPSPSASEAKVRVLPVKLVDEILSVLDNYADPTGYMDEYGESRTEDAELHEGLLAKATAEKLRSALSSDQVETAPQGTETPAGREHYLTAVQANELGIEWTPPSPSPSTPSKRKET